LTCVREQRLQCLLTINTLPSKANDHMPLWPCNHERHVVPSTLLSRGQHTTSVNDTQ
jgi:hypothetical protein